MSNLEIGSIIDATVINIKPYGVFVDVGNKQKGLVHISHISSKYIKDVNSVLKSGDKIKVKVLSLEDNKLSLSIKEADDILALRDEEKEDKTFSKNIEVTHKCLSNKEKMQESKNKTFDELMKDFNRQSNDKLVDINRRLKNRYI